MNSKMLRNLFESAAADLERKGLVSKSQKLRKGVSEHSGRQFF